jgi:hypothetical protein
MIFSIYSDLDYGFDFLVPSISKLFEDIILSYSLVLDSMCMLYMDLGSHELSVSASYNCNILSVLFLLYLDLYQNFLCSLD